MIQIILLAAVAITITYLIFGAGKMLMTIPLSNWRVIGYGIVETLLRVTCALSIAMIWTVPLGVAIGTNQRLATILQPIVQVTASIPATALFPVILLIMINLPGGLNLAAIVLMLMGTQWYLLFNIIAGASAIPQDLKYTTQLMHLTNWQRWRILILPAIFPLSHHRRHYGKWWCMECQYRSRISKFWWSNLSVNGIGSLIAKATAQGNYPLLMAATLSMILTVIILNRLVWRRLYKLAEEKYRMEV